MNRRVVSMLLVMMLAPVLGALTPQRLYAGGPAAPPVVTPVSPAPAPAPIVTPPNRVVLRFYANLRTGPGTAFAVARVAAAGEVFTVLACNEACDWYMVEAGIWIAAFLVSPLDPDAALDPAPPLVTPVLPAEPAPGTVIQPPGQPPIEPPLVEGAVIVRVDTYIYRGPGTAYRIADVARQGERVVVMGRNSLGNWFVLVSGDWIAASAVLNPPRNLPIAWEPPPPPGGPELPTPPLPPPPAAVPSVPAPAPVVIPAAADIAYVAQLPAVLELYVQGSNQLVAQMEALSRDTTLVADAGWRGQTAAGILTIREANQAVAELTPGPRTIVVHNQYLLAAQSLDAAMDLIQAGLDEIDSEKLIQGVILVTEAALLMQEAAQILETLSP